MSNTKPNRLYVGNIDFRMTREDVKDLFSEVGIVSDVFFPKDNNDDSRPHRGFVFVEMESRKAAEEAIEEFHGTKDDYGRKLIVRIADVRRNKS